MSDEGGDPVCWLHLVCERCGRLVDHDPPRHAEGDSVLCRACAAVTPAEPAGAT